MLGERALHRKNAGHAMLCGFGAGGHISRFFLCDILNGHNHWISLYDYSIHAIHATHVIHTIHAIHTICPAKAAGQAFMPRSTALTRHDERHSNGKHPYRIGGNSTSAQRPHPHNSTDEDSLTPGSHDGFDLVLVDSDHGLAQIFGETRKQVGITPVRGGLHDCGGTFGRVTGFEDS